MMHTLTALVEKKPATLMRLCGIIQRFNIAISSLNVGECHMAGCLRVTVIFQSPQPVAELIRKQFERSINVLEVQHLRGESSVERRSTLIKIRSAKEDLPEVFETAHRLNANFVNLAEDHMVFEISGSEECIQNAVSELHKRGIHEVDLGAYVTMQRRNPERQRQLVS